MNGSQQGLGHIDRPSGFTGASEEDLRYLFQAIPWLKTLLPFATSNSFPLIWELIQRRQSLSHC